MIEVVTDAARIREAHSTLHSRLVAEADYSAVKPIGWQGGGAELEAYWHERSGFWYAHQRKGTRYWNAFGLEEPRSASNLTIVAEINPPLGGRNRRVAGAFGADEDGNLYLLHRGKIGGGRKGIGKDAFLAVSRDSLLRVEDGGKTAPMFIVARLGDSMMTQHIANFLDQVDAFKRMVSEDRLPSDMRLESSFTPEFEGRAAVSSYVRTEAIFSHGTVVRLLRRQLVDAGLQTSNDMLRDLFIPGQDGVRALFEMKTSADRQSVYTAVGQLTLNADPSDPPIRVAVLPADCPADLRQKLEAWGIRVLLYEWQDSEPVFRKVGELCKELGAG